MASSKTYGFASDAYLQRARSQLDSGTCEGLFYAAYELRCGIEARMREYLDGHDHISKGQKEEWKLGKLNKAVETDGAIIHVRGEGFPEFGVLVIGGVKTIRNGIVKHRRQRA